MANESGKNERRTNLPYWEGVNAVVSRVLAKKTEFAHAENIHSEIVGTAQKRKGQVVIGTNLYGGRFHSDKNHALWSMPLTPNGTKNLYRASTATAAAATMSVSVYDALSIADTTGLDEAVLLYTIQVAENITLVEPPLAGTNDASHFYIDNIDYSVSMFSLSLNDVWVALSDSEAQNIPAAQFDTVSFDSNMALVNQRALNRYVKSDGVTVLDSTDPGSLYNTPRAALVSFYKNRLYLADFVRDGVRYGTSILRSSYPSGIIALVNGDVTASTNIPVTDTKYFYADSGMNTYEVWRGGVKVSDMTVTAIQETSITASGAQTFLSADEIWIAGTYTGEKQYRWINNPTSFGRDVKQYDTFKLAGGDNDPITLLENIGNVMMIANRQNIATWNDYTLEQLDLGIGCVSRRGHVKAYGTLYFIDYTGIYATSGGLPTILSSPIQPYIDGATRAGKESSAAGRKGRSVFFTLGDVTLYHADGSVKRVLRDVCVEHNLLQQNWFIHTNVKADDFHTFIDSLDSGRLVLSDNDGSHQIKAFLEGVTDDGEEIFMRADTHSLPLSDDIENISSPYGIIVTAERGSMMEVFVGLDDEPFYPIEGRAEKGVTSLKITASDKTRGQPPTCRRIAFSFRDSSRQICKLGPAVLTYVPGTSGKPS